MKSRRTLREFIMDDTDDGPSRRDSEYLKAAARLGQPLGELAEAMDQVERIGAQIPYSTYMVQVVADRAKWHKLKTMTLPVETFAASLADPDTVQEILQLLAPSLVFPAATPMQIDFSGEALHRARQEAELHKENLRSMISAEVRRINSMNAE
jgi:hypothetical protein